MANSFSFSINTIIFFYYINVTYMYFLILITIILDSPVSNIPTAPDSRKQFLKNTSNTKKVIINHLYNYKDIIFSKCNTCISSHPHLWNNQIWFNQEYPIFPYNHLDLLIYIYDKNKYWLWKYVFWRGSLMDAIREAGGSKNAGLKSASGIN